MKKISMVLFFILVFFSCATNKQKFIDEEINPEKALFEDFLTEKLESTQKSFTFYKSGIKKQANTIYLGRYLKHVCIHTLDEKNFFVISACFRGRGEKTFTDWAHISVEKIDENNKAILLKFAESLKRTYVRGFDEYLYFLELVKRPENSYFWWEDNSILFFQDVYIMSD